MNSLSDLEKKINSELTTKNNDSKIMHEQLYLNIDNEDLLDVILFKFNRFINDFFFILTVANFIMTS